MYINCLNLKKRTQKSGLSCNQLFWASSPASKDSNTWLSEIGGIFKGKFGNSITSLSLII